MNEDSKLIEKIVSLYGIGRLKNFHRLKREAILEPAYVIETSTGKYFSKRYRRNDYYTRKGFWLVKYLDDKGYPAVTIIPTLKRKYYVLNEGKAYALFKFLDLPGLKSSISRTEAYNYGVALGRLHRLTRSINVKTRFDFYKRITGIFLKRYYLANRAPKRLRSTLRYFKENLPSMKAPRYLPKAYLHSEFTTEHVFFKRNKVWKVVDFEDYYRDYMFYDIGTPMMSIIEERLDFEKLRAYISGYESQRKLTLWEKEHLFEAALLGAFRFCAWAMDNIETWGWSGGCFKVSKELVDIGKSRFMMRLQDPRDR